MFVDQNLYGGGNSGSSRSMFYDPAQAAKIKRQRALAQQMMDNSKAKPLQMVSGFVVPQSPWAALAQGVQGVAGNYIDRETDTQETEMAKRKQQMLAEALGEMRSNPEAAAQILAQDPSMANVGFDILQKSIDAENKQKLLQGKMQGMTTGGATGALADRLIAQGVDPVEAIMIAKSGLGQGRTYNPETGKVESMGGFNDALGGAKQAETMGKEIGKTTSEAQTGLPKIIDNADIAMNNIDYMIGNPDRGIPQHAGLNAAVGTIDARLPTFNPSTKDFENRLAQAQGGAFLSAYDTLKGGGQITEPEGKKATEALTRMNLASSEEEFIKAAQEYRGIVSQGVERAKRAAQGNYTPQGRRTVVKQQRNPKTGQVRNVYSDGSVEIVQ